MGQPPGRTQDNWGGGERAEEPDFIDEVESKKNDLVTALT